jgi:hypothetical protein
VAWSGGGGGKKGRRAPLSARCSSVCEWVELQEDSRKRGAGARHGHSRGSVQFTLPLPLASLTSLICVRFVVRPAPCAVHRAAGAYMGCQPLAEPGGQLHYIMY